MKNTKNAPDVHELLHKRDEQIKCDYYLYAKSYGSECLVFTIEMEDTKSKFDSIEIFANCSLEKTMREWNFV